MLPLAAFAIVVTCIQNELFRAISYRNDKNINVQYLRKTIQQYLFKFEVGKFFNQAISLSEMYPTEILIQRKEELNIVCPPFPWVLHAQIQGQLWQSAVWICDAEGSCMHCTMPVYTMNIVKV